MRQKRLTDDRARHYEETKHMADKEYAEHVNEETRRIAKEYNLNFNFVEKQYESSRT